MLQVLGQLSCKGPSPAGLIEGRQAGRDDVWLPLSLHVYLVYTSDADRMLATHSRLYSTHSHAPTHAHTPTYRWVFYLYLCSFDRSLQLHTVINPETKCPPVVNSEQKKRQTTLSSGTGTCVIIPYKRGDHVLIVCRTAVQHGVKLFQSSHTEG